MSRAFGEVDANGAVPSRLRQPTKVSRTASAAPDDADAPIAANELTLSQLGETPNDHDDPSKKRSMTQAELRESVRERKLAREEGRQAGTTGSRGLNTTFAAPTKSSVTRLRMSQQDVESEGSVARSGVRSNVGLKRSVSSVSGVRAATGISRGAGASSRAGAAAAGAGLNRTRSVGASASTTTSTRPRTATSAAGASRPGAKASAGGSKKRPAWDIKGRLEDMENETRMLRDALKRNHTTVEVLSTQVEEKEAEVKQAFSVKAEIEGATEQVKEELRQALTEKLDLQSKIMQMQGEHNMQTQELLLKHQTLDALHKSTVSSLQMAQAESESLKLTVATQIGQISALQAELTALKASVSQLSEQNQRKDSQIQELNTDIDGLRETIREQHERLLEDETLRKKLHNTIQELKGNIRVFCRVRPMLGDEKLKDGETEPFAFQPHNDKAIDILTSASSTITGKDRGRQFNFTFDKVFRPDSQQADVFAEISQLVQSSLDGYNTCVFAYGQTGSGKTYTMEGPGFDSENMPVVDESSRGMIPRAVEQVFASAEKQKDKGWEYTMEADFLEIYNEQLRDLLAQKASAGTKYEIKHDSKGNTTVTNVRVVPVRTPTQVYDLLKRASANRQTAKTDMNDQSSRSHSVFRLHIRGVNAQTDERVQGILNLIDLAGSERIAQSGTHSGERLKETQNINRSLSALGDVIASLANKDAHTPYRNSKLTYLLQNSLGGNSKTLMFVNISPRPEDLNETISSLRFATKVNNCEIGTAKKSVKVEF